MRGIRPFAAGAAIVAASSVSAFASAGCDAVNAGGLNQNVSFGLATRTVNAAFAAGEVITLSVTALGSPTVGTGGLTLTLGAQTSRVAGAPGAPLLLAGYTAILVANGTETTASISMSTGSSDVPSPITVTCAQAGGAVKKMQQTTTLVAQVSGTAISAAISASIDEGFNDPCDAITPLPNGLRANVSGWRDRDPACYDDNRNNRASSYAADARKKSRASDALIAFDKKPMSYRPPANWRAWIDVRGAHVETSAALNGVRGDQVNVLAGVTRKISRDVVAGVFTGYENFSFASQAVNGRLRGDGWTAGSYVGWRPAKGLRFDAGAAYSGLNYDVAAGFGAAAATASLPGSRWLFTAGLTGSYQWQLLVLEPSARVYWLAEHQNSFADTLGVQYGSRNFTTGRASFGGKAIAPAFPIGTAKFSPYAGLYGDFYFSADDAFAGMVAIGAQPLVMQGWSGRAVAGITGQTAGGTQLQFGSEYGGIGSAVHIWTYRGRIGVPF